MSNYFNSKKVRQYIRKRVTNDVCIEDEIWYSKWYGKKFINERGSYSVKTDDGKHILFNSKLEKEYHK